MFLLRLQAGIFKISFRVLAKDFYFLFQASIFRTLSLGTFFRDSKRIFFFSESKPWFLIFIRDLCRDFLVFIRNLKPGFQNSKFEICAARIFIFFRLLNLTWLFLFLHGFLKSLLRIFRFHFWILSWDFLFLFKSLKEIMKNNADRFFKFILWHQAELLIISFRLPGMDFYLLF